MEDKQKRIARLQSAIEKSHACRANHRRSVMVQEPLPGGRQWKGEVEIFWLTGHPEAKRCFAWFEPIADQRLEPTAVTVLEIPPVIGPATAIKAASARYRRSTQPAA
jgi:hypothetical protein